MFKFSAGCLDSKERRLQLEQKKKKKRKLCGVGWEGGRKLKKFGCWRK